MEHVLRVARASSFELRLARPSFVLRAARASFVLRYENRASQRCALSRASQLCAPSRKSQLCAANRVPQLLTCFMLRVSPPSVVRRVERSVPASCSSRATLLCALRRASQLCFPSRPSQRCAPSRALSCESRVPALLRVARSSCALPGYTCTVHPQVIASEMWVWDCIGKDTPGPILRLHGATGLLGYQGAGKTGNLKHPNTYKRKSSYWSYMRTGNIRNLITITLGHMGVMSSSVCVCLFSCKYYLEQ